MDKEMVRKIMHKTVEAIVLALALLFGVGCVEKNQSSSSHRTDSLRLLAEIQATESGALITTRMETQPNHQSFWSTGSYEVRLTGGDVIYASDGVNNIRLSRNSKDFVYKGEITDLASRNVQLQLVRGPDKYEDALNTIALLPMPALVYADQLMSNDQEIVVDYRLDPQLPGQTQISGTVELLECTDPEDAELLTPYFPKNHSTTIFEGDLPSMSTKDFLPEVKNQPVDYECQFGLQVKTSAPAIVVDSAYIIHEYDTNNFASLIVSEAVSETHLLIVQRTAGESQ